MEEKSYIVDTSVVIEKNVSKLIEDKKISGRIIIPKAVIAELEHQANTGQEIGFLGLDELKNLQELSKQGKIELIFLGERPSPSKIRYAKHGGEIDSMIVDLAYSEGAILITADKIQAESTLALGLEVIYLKKEEIKEKLILEAFFDDKTMSVHLKEDCFPLAKKNFPDWSLVKVSEDRLGSAKIQEIIKEVVERSRIEPKAFIEISRRGSTIIQYKNYRVVITKPPVSDGWELTAVRPLKQLTLDEYKLPEIIEERIKKNSKGVIIAGETGSGKSTFAQALAEFYSKSGKITKTVESPRDLVLSDEITQYSKNFTSSEEIHDILFLSRPDYIIFDEMRDTPDFKLYIDLRLAGSNVLGVLHSATPIDAIQRFIGRLDTGMIPGVLDTILFIEKGEISKVFTLKMVVKVPFGMVEADLARPVIEVRNFKTNKLEFEIYSYGEETVIIPVVEERKNSVENLALKQIENEFLKYVNNLKAEFINNSRVRVYLDKKDIPRIIGKNGENINNIEKKLGISIDVVSLEKEKTNLKYGIKESNKNIVFDVGKRFGGKEIDCYVDDKFLFTIIASKKGEVNVNKKSNIGKELEGYLNKNKKIELKV